MHTGNTAWKAFGRIEKDPLLCTVCSSVMEAQFFGKTDHMASSACRPQEMPRGTISYTGHWYPYTILRDDSQRTVAICYIHKPFISGACADCSII